MPRDRTFWQTVKLLATLFVAVVYSLVGVALFAQWIAGLVA